MDFDVGAIFAGKVTGITKFGAFVSIAPGKSGLVHISEIASTYVSDVREHLAEGQDVMVKVIGIDQSGRMNLSIKSAVLTAVTPIDEPRQPHQPRQPRQMHQQPQIHQTKQQAPVSEPSFEDKLKRFMQDSDNKMSGLKQYSDRKGARRRGK